MNPDQDMSRYYIEDTFLLKFLIIRYAEMLRMERPRLVSVWGGLGLVGLYQNTELRNAFKILISSSSYTPEEVLNSSIDLFLAELNRLEAADSPEYLKKQTERQPMRPGTARKLLSWCWREGRKMVREGNFEFYPVWELISWLELECDEEIREFEEKCRFSPSPAEEKLEQGLDVVKQALRRYMHRGNPTFQNN
jgi:hypothetical protein